jgi:monofunctional biosynthetic peptidoglycan transglycosylase
MGYLVLPYPWTLRIRNPERTSLMEQRIGEAHEAGNTLDVRQSWVPLDSISPNLVRAVEVAEDYRFREHRGIDWVSLAEEVRWSGDDDFSWLSVSDLRALASAIAYVRSNRDEIRGRSTITQQLAKNVYFGTERSLLRKAMEFVVAGRLERKLGKDRILELYLNIVEWGPGTFGAEAAAQAYFGRSAASLSVDQAAALAATLPHPLTSNPARSPGRMLWRKDLILRRLDPTLDVPPAPMPLPDPRIELPESELVPLSLPDLPGVDSVLPDTGVVNPDTVILRPDTSGARE